MKGNPFVTHSDSVRYSFCYQDNFAIVKLGMGIICECKIVSKWSFNASDDTFDVTQK